MNAKFEKWWGDNSGAAPDPMCLLVESACADAWQAAIQSLEVTPELVGVGMRAEIGPWKLEDLVCDPNYLDLIVESILESVLSALKEQAK